MGNSSAQRILTYTGLFVGGSVLACPAVGAGAAAGFIGAGAASLFGNTLATDLHDSLCKRSFDPLTNHDLQQLTGRSLAILIECYEKEQDPPTKAERWLPLLRRPDKELSALAKVAKSHWDTLDLTGDSAALEDNQIHRAFLDSDRSDDTPLLPVDEWDRHLLSIAEKVQESSKATVWLRVTGRKPLAEYIAPRFAFVVRELVKADLDPAHGTGGRVFIALHLDMMRSLHQSIQNISGPSPELVGQLQQLVADLKTQADQVTASVTPEQAVQIRPLIRRLEDQHQQTRDLLAAEAAKLHQRHDQTQSHLKRNGLFALITFAVLGVGGFLVWSSLDRNDRATHEKMTEEGELTREELAKLVTLLETRKEAATPTGQDRPAGPPALPTLTEEEEKLLARAKAQGDRLTRIQAALVEGDFDTADALLEDKAKTQATQAAFDYLTAEGDRWYLAGDYDKAIKPYEQAYALRPDNINAANDVVNAQSFARLGDIVEHRRRAIVVAEKILSNLSIDSTDWAMTQNNLGNAWASMPTGKRGDNLQKAIDAYQNALQVYTRDDHPINWAKTQNNLGETWRNLPTGNRGKNLQKAIDAYQNALQIRTRDDHPVDWAMTQNNLGVAWANRPTGKRGDNLQKAIDAYQNALQIYTRDAHPVDWAMIQNNLGETWRNMPTGNRGENLQKAIDAYQNALQIYTRDAHPVDWAMTQNNLSSAWQYMPTGNRGENLQKGIDAYQNALQIRTRDDHPVDWAITQNNLGVAWANRPTGKRGDNLQKAIDAYQNALQIYTRDAHPVEWAMTQNNIGVAWRNMPTGDRGENLQKAIDAYQNALQIYTRDAHPVEWAMTQNNLGSVSLYMLTGDRGANLQQAIDAYQNALQIYTRDAHPVDWAMIQYNLGLAWSELAEVEGQDRCGRLQQAIACSKASLQITTPEAFPREHAETTHNMAIDRRAYEAAGCADAVPFDDIAPAD